MVATSWKSSTVTSKDPVSLMCSGSRMCLRSTSIPLAALIASTTSAGPIEPNRRPPPGGPPAHLLGLALPSVSGQNRAALGKEEVAGEAARHLDDVPAASDADHV